MDSDKVDRLRDRLLMCPICMDEYKDPRLLPCHHTVCLDCINNIIQASSYTGRVFRCPQCRRDVPVPHGGIKDFPLNFYIISLQDELGTRLYNDTCDVCHRDWLISQFRCVDCDMVICKFCIHEHRLFQHEASRQYNIMRIEISPADVAMASTRSCPQHPEEVLQLFCCTCDKPVCITCMCHDHKRHETVPMATKLSDARTYLQDELDRLGKEKRDVHKTLSDIQTTTEDVTKWADDAKQRVQQRGKCLHDKIDRLIQHQVSLVSDGERKSLHDLGCYSKELRGYSEETEKGVRFLEDLQEGDMCLELLDCYSRFRGSLQDKKSRSVNKVIKLRKFSFSAGWDKEFQHYFVGNVGRIDCETSHQKFYSKPSLLDRFALKKIVRRMLTPRNICLYLIITIMLSTIGRLAYWYMTDPRYTLETGVGLVFCVYLFLASVFAYRKSYLRE